MKHGLRCFLGASLLVIVVGLAGCGPAAKSGTVPGSAMGAPAANPPSVAQPVPTGVAGVASTPVAPMGDTAGWKTSQHTAGTLTYSYLYPAGWTADLSYCAAGSAMNGTSNELPAGCVSTDILLGQKAADLGTLSGESLTINGKQAVTNHRQPAQHHGFAHLHPYVVRCHGCSPRGLLFFHRPGH